ncbi:hypothetical protein H6A66_03955 [Bacteroides caecigallinarum]|uniref:hypothetical protein n=1 Tax=Bacteroides caecigallinarum TaxID=1411144 RepID=UPI00195A2FDF|nr:hypothetical protein [Bacteroides caecigallinarum]MBM6864332.1 hypothetical protein [Bacteroides caecigallinarum]
MNITYTEKDNVLRFLVENEYVTPESFIKLSLSQIMDETGYNSEYINAVLEGFQKEGLISDLNLRYGVPSFYLIVHQSAFDLFNRDGFTMKENLLQKEVEKLLLEVERLKPSLGDKIEQITTIANNIMSIIKPF